ncbi:exosome complex component RRP46 [Pancytospora philotis]|nr:exosome complex component RRP46 [Pancytospora philotis]
MSLTIEHGMYSTYAGSAKFSTQTQFVVAAVQSPADAASRNEGCPAELVFDVRCKCAGAAKAQESLIAALVAKLLRRYVVAGSDVGKTMVVSICANTYSLSLILNAVLVACVDGGIPLSGMFFCAGEEELFVLDESGLALRHSLRPCTAEILEQARAEAMHAKECIEASIRDMFEFRH